MRKGVFFVTEKKPWCFGHNFFNTQRWKLIFYRILKDRKCNRFSTTFAQKIFLDTPYPQSPRQANPFLEFIKINGKFTLRSNTIVTINVFNAWCMVLNCFQIVFYLFLQKFYSLLISGAHIPTLSLKIYACLTFMNRSQSFNAVLQ